MASFLQDLKSASASFLSKAKRKIRDIVPIGKKTKEAADWFMDLIQGLTRDKPTSTRAGKVPLRLNPVSVPKIGGLYYYSYDAKHKFKLKYFDEFPIIVCVELNADGWFGLNLHYIPPQDRQELLTALMKIGNSVQSEMQYMNISYSLLKQVSASTMWKACFKRYLTPHVKSKIIEVNPMDWERVIFLPQEQFVTYNDQHNAKRGAAPSRKKVSKMDVWRDSAKKR